MRVLDPCKLYLLLMFALTIPTAAQADPILITGGSASAYWNNAPTGIFLGGPGVELVLNGSGEAAASWMPGSMGDLDGTFTLETSSLGRSGDVVINGVVYKNPFMDGSTIVFDTAPFLIPSSGPLQTGFTASGRIRGYATPSQTGTPLFDIDIVGSGFAFVMPHLEDGLLVNRTVVIYNFEESQAAVPEPSTMLFIGTGLAGVIRLRRRLRARTV